ncbi:hypothetical protein JDV09_08725 [Mycobacterium sp. Y57]|uniref:hypothetical protein n=1 Tax=Mycolicibacterium xanthum TaxID=2796469 RepID=UPI001C861BEA|nr:hypothetical protein [Mycolicibacterium xanthum]MBX7432191.1 hypothetical protein [Mycolicibacterium xanthum]
MSCAFDVSSRLADGRTATETLQVYVSASARLGYLQPELTSGDTALRDAYDTEAGMDLQVLQRDCITLQDVGRALTEALQIQSRGMSVLADAWRGAGAEACVGFLRRHDDASAAVAAAVRTAAEALRGLREDLWRAVDEKVDAVLAIEALAGADRPRWLAAAATVTTGVGDRPAASEIVDRSVKPFVANTVGTDWVAAMVAASAEVHDAYDRAVAEIRAEPVPVFGIPGDLGPPSPEPTPVDREPGRGAGVFRGDSVFPGPVTTAPAGWSPASPMPPAAWAPAPPAESAVPAPSAGTAPLAGPAPPAGPALPEPMAAPPVPAMAPTASPGAAVPDIGGGLSGLGRQFADSLGGLLGGGSAGGLEAPDLDVPELGEPDDAGPADEPDEDNPTDDEDNPTDDEDNPTDDESEPADDEPGEATDDAAELTDDESEPTDDEAEPEPGGELVEPAPTAPPPPPPAEPLPPVAPEFAAGPAADEPTPCEIAAGELPQVGDPAG